VKDTRNLVRLTTSTLVHFTAINSSVTWTATLTDISNDGFHCVRFSNIAIPPLMRTEELQCRFVLPNGAIDATARVMWTAHNDQEFGLRFAIIAPDMKERVEAYCANPF
jgi:hypothetical protein